MEYYAAQKVRNPTTWMNLEDRILSEISQSQKKTKKVELFSMRKFLSTCMGFTLTPEP